jgi:hypothetical protein
MTQIALQGGRARAGEFMRSVQEGEKRTGDWAKSAW